MSDVVALGELLIDFASVTADDAGYPTMKANPGGAPCNFLAAINAYGLKTAFIGKVGCDAFGELLIKTLKESGIDTRGIVCDDGFFTTLAFVTFDEKNDRSFSFARKPGADTQLGIGDIDLALIEEASVFHFGTLSLTDEPARSSTHFAVDHAKKHGKLITFDPNLRKPLWKSEDAARGAMLWGFDRADVVKISDDEVDFVWGVSCVDGAKRLIKDHGVSLAMVTQGAKGCYLCNETAYVFVPAPEVTPVDTTGAGDIFGGSAVARLLELNKSPSLLSESELLYIASYAVTAASLSTEKSGSIPSIPVKDEVLSYLKKHSDL